VAAGSGGPRCRVGGGPVVALQFDAASLAKAARFGVGDKGGKTCGQTRVQRAGLRVE